jgi:hypothetical protein
MLAGGALFHVEPGPSGTGAHIDPALLRCHPGARPLRVPLSRRVQFPYHARSVFDRVGTRIKRKIIMKS